STHAIPRRRHMRATTGGFLGLLAAALGGGTPCAAQGSLEFAGFGGLYAPSPGLLHLPGFSPGDWKGQLPQHTASVVGARVTAWVDRQIAAELAIDHSGLQSSGAFGNKADFTTGSARLLVRIVPRTSPTSGAVAFGFALPPRVTRAWAPGPTSATRAGHGTIARTRRAHAAPSTSSWTKLRT